MQETKSPEIVNKCGKVPHTAFPHPFQVCAEMSVHMKTVPNTLGDKNCAVLVSFLSHSHMLVIEPYADRVDIELVTYDQLKRERTIDTFERLHKEYMNIHEHSTRMFCADDYFLTVVAYNDLTGIGVRRLRHFVSILNLRMHLRTIQRKYCEGVL